MVKLIKSIYEWGIKVLLLPFFKWAYMILSHGLFHILLLIIVAILASYFYFDNKDKLSETVAHNIYIKTEACERYPDESGDRGYESLESLHVDVILNSDTIKKETGGKYKDAVTISYTVPQTKVGNRIEPLTSDTVNVAILRQPCRSGIEGISFEKNIPQDRLVSVPEKGDSALEVLKDSGGVSIFRTTLTNMVRVPFHGGYWTRGRKIRLYSSDFGIGKSPYYYYNIKFDLPNPEEMDSIPMGNFSLRIVLDDSAIYDNMFGLYSNKQLIIHKIEPQPDYVDGSVIQYVYPESLKSIYENDGVFLYAEDLESSNRDRQKEFLNSVLFGTCLAFMLDILIELVIKLRRLHQTRKKKSDKL